MDKIIHNIKILLSSTDSLDLARLVLPLRSYTALNLCSGAPTSVSDRVRLAHCRYHFSVTQTCALALPLQYYTELDMLHKVRLVHWCYYHSNEYHPSLTEPLGALDPFSDDRGFR